MGVMYTELQFRMMVKVILHKKEKESTTLTIQKVYYTHLKIYHDVLFYSIILSSHTK